MQVIISYEIMKQTSRGLDESVREYIERLIMEKFLPDNISPRVIEKYIRKAIQSRIWYYLSRVDRALLILTRRLPRIKSPVLKQVLKKIFLEIELYTIRGKALFYGLLIAMKNPIYKLEEIIHNIKRIITIGIQYLNNPQIYRIFG
ncbi:MAG: hypothetical protein ABWW65_04235 [Thermoprotei archaeon]